MNKEIFVANHKHDLLGLQEIKAKFKMIAGSVIQDVYNLLQSTQAVEGILSLAFPR
jgi:exonuclease III